MTDDPHPPAPETIKAARAEIEYLVEVIRHHLALAEAARRRRDALKALVGQGERLEKD